MKSWMIRIVMIQAPWDSHEMLLKIRHRIQKSLASYSHGWTSTMGYNDNYSAQVLLCVVYFFCESLDPLSGFLGYSKFFHCVIDTDNSTYILVYNWPIIAIAIYYIFPYMYYYKLMINNNNVSQVAT